MIDFLFHITICNILIRILVLLLLPGANVFHSIFLYKLPFIIALLYIFYPKTCYCIFHLSLADISHQFITHILKLKNTFYTT